MVAYGHIIPKLSVNIKNVQIALITGLGTRIIDTDLLVTPMTIVDGTEQNMYHIVSNSKRKCKRCDDCKMYNPCSTYEGFCLETNELVDGNFTCESWY